MSLTVPTSNLSPAQTKIVAWLRDSLITENVGKEYATKSEIKTLETLRFADDVDEEGTHGSVLVRVCFGRVNDEGTAAEIYCRTQYAFMITKRGACTRIDSETLWKGHPSRTWFMPTTKKEGLERAAARRKETLERKKRAVA